MSSKKPTKYRNLLIRFGVSACALLIYIFRAGPALAYSAEVGNRAADFTGFDIVNREPVHFKDYLGQWVFMEFWATWCGPCMRGLPNMLEQTKPFVESGRLKVITVSGDLPEMRSELSQTIDKYNITYPVIYDGGIYDPQNWHRPIVAVEWGVHAWPTTFLINPQGVIVANNLRGDKLGPELEFFLTHNVPTLGLNGKAVLNEDGSISVFANVMNSNRQNVELRMRGFMERIIWDENHYWRDIVDVSGSPLSMSATVSFGDTCDTIYEFRVDPPAEEWHSFYGGLYLRIPGSNEAGIDQDGFEIYYGLNEILTVDIQDVGNERLITPKGSL